MKNKQKMEIVTDELATDEEILTRGATRTKQKIGDFDLRPILPTAHSIFQRMGFFSDNDLDVYLKVAIYGFVLSADIEEVNSVAFNKKDFLIKAQEWMDKNFKNVTEMQPLATFMNKNLEEYAAAISSGGTPYKGNGSKN